jgi:colanic acid/amylovoran biosynthesis glycosyltransferase
MRKVKILHAHFGNNGIKCLELKKQLKVPMICNFYGYDAFKIPDDRDYYKNLNKLFQEADKFFVLGPVMKKKLMELNCAEHKIHIQHLGVDLNRIEFKPRKFPKNGKFKFLIASSFVPKKGIDDALTALSRLKNNLDFTVHIIGDGYLKNDILELIEKLKMAPHIIMHGYQPYPKFIQLISECHAFLQASKTADNNDKEGTPMAIVDAMAAGLPVVSTYHSDIPEIVRNEKTGFLANESDPEGFSEAILKLISNDKIYEAASRASRIHIEEEFDAKIQSLKVEKIYDNLIGNVH